MSLCQSNLEMECILKLHLFKYQVIFMQQVLRNWILIQKDSNIILKSAYLDYLWQLSEMGLLC